MSTAFIVTPRHGNEVYLLLIVIPRSFSSALLSMRRSVATVCAPCFMSVSSSVVFPWSTCAMIAKFLTRP